MNVSIPILHGGQDIFETKGPWWSPLREPDGSTSVLIRCGGECGDRMALNERHVVDGSGRVTPSILCPSCGWHVFGTLEDWS